MINVEMPANCQLVFSIFVKIATFDLIPVDGIMNKIDEFLDLEPDIFLNENFIELGYDSTNPL